MNGRIVLGIKMNLKEAQEILTKNKFILEKTNDGRIYKEFPIGYLKDDENVKLIMTLWMKLSGDKFVKDSTSLDVGEWVGNVLITNTELTNKYIPHSLQYKPAPSAIKNWASKQSSKFIVQDNIDKVIQNYIDNATEMRLNKIEKDRQTKYETEFKNELSDLLKKYNGTLYASSDVFDYGDQVYTTLGVKFSNNHDCELDSTNGDEDAVFA